MKSTATAWMSAAFFSAAVGSALSGSAAAAPLTPGNIVVYRIGTGTGSLVATGNPVFLDEYNPNGNPSLPLAPVQTLAMPTAANGLNAPFAASGTAGSDGLLTRSASGNCLIVPGYGRDPSITTGNLTSTAGVTRVVAKVATDGSIDTTTALTDAATSGNFRGAVSDDCIRAWTSGSTGGVRHVAALGNTTSIDITGAGYAASRAIGIANGQLYTSTNSGTNTFKGVETIGTGLPTAATQTATRLPGLTDTTNPSTYGFFFADLSAGVAGLDTLYVADDAAGALTKFSLVTGSWVSNGTIGTASDAYRGLTGVVVSGVVTLYATRKGGTTASGGGELVKLVDGSGYNGAFSGVPTVLATAAANTAFRGVALAPGKPIVTPSAGSNGSISPNSPQSVFYGDVLVFTVTADPGYTAVVGGTCGGTLVGNTFTTSPITTHCTVSATFTSLPTYTVTPSASSGGTISPDTPQTVQSGATTAFTVTPSPGYSVSVGSTCGGSLAGNTFTTNAITADCAVIATFTQIPYTVTPSAGSNGSISPPTPQSVLYGNTTSFTVTPAPGYSVAMRGTCGGTLTGTTYTIKPITADCTVAATFSRKLVLFIGNSYTFGRIDPVMSYNTANVTDLTHAMWLANSTGSNPDEPHPWGGIPGVFKKMADQAGLDYDVSISARNAASLRGHYLNSNPAGWDLRGNAASQRWDAVVLQDLSDEPLPPGRGHNANLPYFNAYADKFESWIHVGAAETYTETALFGGGSAATCASVTGASTTTCDAVRTIAPANAHANPAARIYLYQTWARPDLIAPNGTNVNGTTYTAAEGLEAMTADFHNAYFGRAAANPGFSEVAPVGDAFLRAVTSGIAMRDPYVPEAGKINLWHTDHFHPSKYGSYLSALVHFATITGIDPTTLGSGEQSAIDLGISSVDAVALQQVAKDTVVPLFGTFTLSVTKAGTGNGSVASAGTGIACGATCSASYLGTAVVTLTATPAEGSTFAGWSGGTGGAAGCTGTGACVVAMGANASVVATFSPTGPANVAFPDFNADNKPDILWRHTVSGALYVWYMNGVSLISDQLITGVDPSWKMDGIADFNGDGHPDIVWRNGAGSTYVWYLVNGVFQSDAFLFSLPPEWVIQGVADFNADGKPDFLMRNTNSGNAFAWFFNNNVAIGDQFLFNIDPSWKVEGVGDFNADGQPDLLFRNMGSGLAFAWNTQYAASNLSLTTSSPSIFSIDPTWEVVQIADWNNDGHRDLLFRNRDTGVVFVWYMNGTTLTTSDFIIQIDPSWEIVPRR